MATMSSASSAIKSRAAREACDRVDIVALDEASEPEQAGLGEQMVDEKAAHHERDRSARTNLLQKRQRQQQQAHLADRGIAEQPLDFGLGQTDEVGEEEGHAAGECDEAELPLEQRQKLQERKENTGRHADRDHGGHATRRRLVNVEPPAIRRKRLQFDDEAGKDEQQGRRPDRAGNLRAGIDQRIDVEHPRCVVEQHRRRAAKRSRR